jgi:hypothetical protein
VDVHVPRTLAKYRPPSGKPEPGEKGTATVAAGAQQSSDPNLPYYRGTIKLPPNPEAWHSNPAHRVPAPSCWEHF